MSTLLKSAALAAATLYAGHATAQIFCIYDPLGAQGDYYALAKDYQVAAKRWNVQLDLRVFTDDDAMDQEFRKGDCDMASMLGMRARAFNRFAGSIDSPAAIDNYSQLRSLLQLVSSPKLGPYMSGGGYEIVGVVPVGAIYPVVNDRHINGFAKAVGKRVGIFAWDKPQVSMAQHFHVIPVPLTLTEYGPAFNKGKVDAIVAPLILFKAMELEKGTGANGGIVRRALLQLTMQLVTHSERFPVDFGQKSREYMMSQVDRTLSVIRNQEASVDSHLWIYAMKSELVDWQQSMRELSHRLVKEGYYDNRMLEITLRVRCRGNMEDPECNVGAPAQAPATQ